MGMVESESNPVNILVVEDNPIDRKLLARRMLKEEVRNPLVFAGDGIEALEILRRRDAGGIASPFLVLLDLRLPKMNGFEFLDAVRDDPELAKSIVVVLTTSDDERDVDEAYRRQVAGYLSKEEVLADFGKLKRLIEAMESSLRFPVIDPGQSLENAATEGDNPR